MQTLAWIRRKKFRAVPLAPQSKAAVSKDYTALDYDPPGDELWLRHDYGVGVVTGPRHHGPVDIDLDCEEAVFFASRFLPATVAVFGRLSKPRSHYLYCVDATSFDKQSFIDPIDRTTIIEMRGDNGHQTVMPGSLHQDTGELIEWSDIPFPDVPTGVSADVLKSAGRCIAIATLIARHMWHEGSRNEVCKLLAGTLWNLGWEQEATETMMQAVMDYTRDDDKTRIRTVRITYDRGAAGKKVAGAPKLRQYLRNDQLVDKLLEWSGSQRASIVQEYNDRFAVVQIGGKYRIADTDVRPGDPPIFLGFDDFHRFRLSDMIEEDGKFAPKSRLWLKNPQHREYRRVDFLPGIEDDDGTILNLWTGWAVPPSEQGSCDGWIELLRDVICGGDEELNTWMLNWFANILREPMRKPPTAPVIIGEQGAAKTILVKYFGRILGRAYIPVTNEQHIYGHFNSHLATTLLLHSEEALYAGDRRHRGIVKSLISDEFCALEKKGVDVERTHSYLRLILTSNEDHAAPAEASERRYTVINMRERRASDDLIERVGAELDSGTGPAALHRYLLELPYDFNLIRVNVKNTDLAELKSVNMDPVQNWWYDVLCSGALLPDNLAWAQENLNDDGRADWPSVVGIPAVYLFFIFRLRERGIRTAPSSTSFGMHMRKFMGRTLNRSKRPFDNPRLDDVPMEVRNLDGHQNVWTNIPALVECRTAFERYMKQKLEWPEDDTQRRPPREHDKF